MTTSLAPRRGRGRAQATTDAIQACYEFAEQRQPISVRGVAYALFVGGGIIPNMSTSSTQKVSRWLTMAREEGFIPWEWIVEKGRAVRRYSSWDNPQDYLTSVRWSYTRDRWQDQPYRLLLISEKATVEGVLQPVLDRYALPFTAVSGWDSATNVYEIANESVNDRRPLTILYIGDYDPSGMYMSEIDLPRRIERYGGEVEFERIALREEHLNGLPSFPAQSKIRDSRYRWFVERYGHDCWELDALDPNLLRNTVESWVQNYLDVDAWYRASAVNEAEFKSLQDFFDGWGVFSYRSQNNGGAS